MNTNKNFMKNEIDTLTQHIIPIYYRKLNGTNIYTSN